MAGAMQRQPIGAAIRRVVRPVVHGYFMADALQLE